MAVRSRKGRSRTMAMGLAATLLAVIMLSACIGQGKPAEQEPRVLKIATMYGDEYSMGDLRSQYLDIFQYLNPHIETEIMTAIDWNAFYRYRNPNEPIESPNPMEEMKKLLEGPNPPDVVILNDDFLTFFIHENLLMPLDPYIQQSKFDLDGYVPGVIEAIRNKGNQSIYALAPQFGSQALIYNKQMFLEAGVPFPEDGMTWQEMFDLAKRISAHYGGEKFGFSFNTYKYISIMDAIFTYASPLQIQLIDAEGQHLLVDSPQWRRVFGELLALFEQNVIPDQQDFAREGNRDYYSPIDYDTFLSGQVAMAIVHHSYLNDLINTNERAHQIDGFDGIEWDVVTLPHHPEAPGVGGMMYFEPLMAINANAANPDDAWALISFINGEEWAEHKSRSTSGMIMSRVDYIRPLAGADYNMEAFYKMKPSPPWIDVTVVYNNLEISEALYMGENKFWQVLEGQKSLDEALAEWQTEGNALLKERRENASSGGSMGGIIVEEVEMMPIPAQ